MFIVTALNFSGFSIFGAGWLLVSEIPLVGSALAWDEKQLAEVLPLYWLN
jgi:hypothetical protein